ncbi:MAG: CDP-glucose 4,6-dehydratase [Caballeronia mineralivorans]|jgi:CDP-glucose 4,6-dehydratase|nr:CDP-glucose 4,6-dehydratase [Caballeronia mineralivorans]
MAAPLNRDFWHGKRVLLTGHTGFKGGWLALWLNSMGARVSGLALPPDTTPSFYVLANVAGVVSGGIGDLREPADVIAAVKTTRPEIAIHLAAQSLVLTSLREPAATFATNVMGTVNLLDALRTAPELRAILVITTDKVYLNSNAGRPFCESDPLGGHDPYSASKSAAELATAAYAHACFQPRGVAVATARGGNVIGGGDFAVDRIVPDVYRAMKSGRELVLRHPHATRPWQHVLDCLAGYLLYAQCLVQRSDIPRSLNFGPADDASVSVAALVEAMQAALGRKPQWRLAEPGAASEMQMLALDSTLARQTLGWENRLIGPAAVRATADWYLAFSRGDDMSAYTLASIEDYLRS